ncbi:MAG: hypothetical protein AAF487_05610 [Bacteroidota bacterium]
MNLFRHKIANLLLLFALALAFSSCEKNELWDVPGDEQYFKSSGGDGGEIDEGDITDDEDDDEDDEDREVKSANK